MVLLIGDRIQIECGEAPNVSARALKCSLMGELRPRDA
jgi:hypothetical protein